MADAAEYNTRVDIRNNYVFDWRFKNNDGTPLDVSDWSFNFKLIDSTGGVIWDIVNADFNRPETNEIVFTKTTGDMVGLLGLYTIGLFVTKAGTVNDTYVYGVYEFFNV